MSVERTPLARRATHPTGIDSALLSDLAQGRIDIIDLTHPLDDDTPVIRLPAPFTPMPRFKLIEMGHYNDQSPLSYKNAFESGEHVGTHFDAPVHWVTGRDGLYVDEIPMQQLIGPAYVIDKTLDAHQDAGLWLTIEDVQRFEREHGPLLPGSWLLLRTGWSARYESEESFLNDSVWPGPDARCARYLSETDILGFGTEAVGIDHGAGGSQDPPFPVHHFLLGGGKFGLASLANLDRLPTTGAVVIAAPLRIRKGSGSPMRAFALVSQSAPDAVR